MAIQQTRLRCVTGTAQVRTALAEALAGGDPVAPLPSQRRERDRTLAVLRPELPVSEPDAAAVVATSGSTGRPKGVVLSRTAIRAAVHASHERLGGPADWLLALPVHYVAGLMVLARAVVAGTRVIPVDRRLDGLPAALDRLADGLAGRGYLAVVPTQLVRALRNPSTRSALAQLDAVVVGGAAADPALLGEARRHGISVVASYGMSETCGGCVYDGWPLAEMRIDVHPSSGVISLAGPLLFSGYRLDPAATRAVLTDGRLTTADRGRWLEGRLVVEGRVDDVVISNGHNVDLGVVERLARRGSDADVAVLGLPDPELGVLVVAVTEGAETLEGLRARLAADLPPAALPRRLVRLPSLPRTSGAKIDRQQLLTRLIDQSSVEAER